MNWEAIFLAGGKLEEKFAPYGPAPGKAYLRLNGKKMAEYPLEALRGISGIRRIVAVIPEGADPFSQTVSVSGGETLMASLSAGFGALKPETEMALVVTADTPFLNTPAVMDFMSQCEREKAGLYYSFVSKADSEAKFPGIPHTYVKLREGRFCGGGLLAIAPSCFQSFKRLMDEVTRKRKSKIALAGIFGFRFIFKLLLGSLAISDLEKRAGDHLGIPAKGILSPYPEVAFNIDDPEALKHALVFMQNQEQGRRHIKA